VNTESATPQDRLRAKQPRRITVGVFLDESLADRLDAAVLAKHQALAADAPPADVEPLQAAVTAAQEALDEATMWFTFAGLGRSAFARLIDEHPPTPQQLADAEKISRAAPTFDPDTFAPALLAASCVSPAGLGVEDFLAIYSDPAWNVEELGSLFAAALSVNGQARPLVIRKAEG
jgi:hypothetical protein